MKKINLVLIITSTLIWSLSTFAISGGWVGNTPIAAYTPQISFASYSSETQNEDDKIQDWNSILLPQGVSRFRANLNYCDTCSPANVLLSLGYDYAFTSKLTTFSLFNWGYSLKSGNGLGSEMALLFGLPDGISHSSLSGTSIGPGIGLAYAFTELDWRFDFSTIVSSSYALRSNEWSKPKLRTDVSLTKWLSNDWGAGVSLSHLYQSKYSFNYSDYEVTSEYKNFTSAKLNLIYKLNKSHEVGLSYETPILSSSSQNLIGLSYVYRW